MRSDLIIICFQLFTVLSCNNVEKQDFAKATQLNYVQETQQLSKNIWKQFKRLPDGATNTLSPDTSCFVIIHNNLIEYYKQGQLKFKDSLIFYEGNDKYKSYRLYKQNDLQIGINQKEETMLITFGHPKGGVAEGDYEYFRKKR